MARLLLLGSGHAHLFVLEALAHGRLHAEDVVLVTPAAEHLYSGMTPGWLEGRYRREELRFDLERLTRAAGARLRLGKAVGIDPAQREVRLQDGSRLEYDVLSIAIGAGPAGLDRVDSAEVIPVKPIDAAERLTQRVDQLAAATQHGKSAADLAVAGTGAAGVELALTARTRLGADARIVLLGGDGPIGGRRGWPERELRRALADRAVTCRLGSLVARVDGGRVELTDGTVLTAGLTLWATGPAAPALFREAGLAVDEEGYLQVDRCLRAVSDARIFAAGDAAAVEGAPDLPRAGVVAVRQGPVLAANLASALGRGRLRRFNPRRWWLFIVNVGDGSAIGIYGPLALRGRWVMWLKDRIDRRFMRRFRNLPVCPTGPAASSSHRGG
jgi:NADH dehydrogenase FAD-containing subunit